MIDLTLRNLIDCGLTPTIARTFEAPLRAAFAFADISNARRAAMFIAQAEVESQGFTSLEENLNYRDPVRVCKLFRTGFDLDRDRTIDPEEIAFARGYVGQPEQLANRAYADRNGNGDEASGDGWTFRGSGIGQLTGRANFEACFAGMGEIAGMRPETLEHFADWIRRPLGACMSFAWFWSDRKLNRYADLGDVETCTRLINGPAMLALDERRRQYLQNLPVFDPS